LNSVAWTSRPRRLKRNSIQVSFKRGIFIGKFSLGKFLCYLNSLTLFFAVKE
jgi:hypothetical protein